MNTPYLLLENICKTFGAASRAQTVLNNLTLRIEEGETVAVLGHSGCGKSTLLNLIAGIDQPDSGRVIVNGQDLTRLSEKARTQYRRAHIGFIYQSFNLIETLTALENIQLPLQLNQFSRNQVDDLSRDMLKRVGLSNKANTFPDQLSGGEQQRVAIARAMVHSPSLVLADEHTGNLDAETGKQMLDLFVEIATQQQQTVLMVTHSRAVASSASRTVLFSDGVLLEGAHLESGNLAW